jgi:hypothetical protein
LIFAEQSQRGKRSGGFIAVDAGGEVNARNVIRETRRWTPQRDQFEFFGFEKGLGTPAVLAGGDFHIAENGANVDCFSVIATVVFAEPLHEVFFGK